LTSLCSLFWLIYLVHTKPFISKAQQRIDIFNEVIFWILSHHNAQFAQAIPASIKEAFAISFISLLAFLVLANAILVVSKVGCKRYLRRYQLRRKQQDNRVNSGDAATE